MFLPCSSESMSSILSAISHLCLLDGPGVLWLAVGLPRGPITLCDSENND